MYIMIYRIKHNVLMESLFWEESYLQIEAGLEYTLYHLSHGTVVCMESGVLYSPSGTICLTSCEYPKFICTLQLNVICMYVANACHMHLMLKGVGIEQDGMVHCL